MKTLLLTTIACATLSLGSAQVKISLPEKTIFVMPEDSYLGNQFTGTRIFWGADNLLIGASDKDNGKSNTEIIVQKLGINNAAGFCDTLNAFGFSDWYLPAQNEILTLNDHKNELGFGHDSYWSSTETSDREAYEFSFDLNAPYGKAIKAYYDYSVRCIRSESVITGTQTSEVVSAINISRNGNVVTVNFPDAFTEKEIVLFDQLGKEITYIKTTESSFDLSLDESFAILKASDGSNVLTQKLAK